MRMDRMDLSGWRHIGETYKKLYGRMKDVEFVGSSDDDLRAFPQVARQRAGYQLHLVQSGQDPSDWKPMATVGPGCREVRIRDSEDAYRAFYVASIGDTVCPALLPEEEPTDRHVGHQPRQNNGTSR